METTLNKGLDGWFAVSELQFSDKFHLEIRTARSNFGNAIKTSATLYWKDKHGLNCVCYGSSKNCDYTSTLHYCYCSRATKKLIEKTHKEAIEKVEEKELIEEIIKHYSDSKVEHAQELLAAVKAYTEKE